MVSGLVYRMGFLKRRCFAAGVFSAALVVSFVSPVFADKTDDDAKLAEELFKAAREAIAKNDYKSACPKFEESLSLVRRAGTLFNLAQCEEHEGRLVKAMRLYKEGIVVLDPGDMRLGPSKKKLAAIEPRIPHITVKTGADFPMNARVTIDGKDIETLGAAVPVDPGEHTVAVLAPKRADETLVVKLAEKEKKELTVQAGKILPDPEPVVTTVQVASALGPRRIVAISLLGLGALGFLGAAVTGGILVDTNATVQKGCPTVQCIDAGAYAAAQTGKTLLVVNTVMWGVGIAGGGAGALLFFLGGNKKAPEKKAASYDVIVHAGYVGIRGSF